MASDQAFCDHVTSRLTPMGPVVGRRMFGGFGIFMDGLMFGLIADDTFYLKVDDDNRPAFEEAGSAPFSYMGRNRPIELSYWRVPEPVYDDPETLLAWSAEALAVARRAKKPARKAHRGKKRGP